MLEFYPDYRNSDNNRTRLGDWLLCKILGTVIKGNGDFVRLAVIRWGISNGGSYPKPSIIEIPLKINGYKRKYIMPIVWRKQNKPDV